MTHRQRSWYYRSTAVSDNIRLSVLFARACRVRFTDVDTEDHVDEILQPPFAEWWFMTQLFMAVTIETSLPPQRLRSQCGQAVLWRLQQEPCKDIPEVEAVELLKLRASFWVQQHVFSLYMDLRWLANNKVRLRRHV